MRSSKLYTQLIVFSFACLLSQTVFAQTENEKRQKANKENDEHLKRVYENNLPNAKGSSLSNVSEDIRIAREAAQKKENEIVQKQAEYEQTKKELAVYAAEDKIRHEERVQAIKKQQQPFMNYLGTELPNIKLFDKVDWYTDHIFIAVEGPKVKRLNNKEVKELDYAAASTALTTFDAVKTKATFEELVSLLDEGKLLFHSTRTGIAYLYERFPEQTKATELFELDFLPYYYGANRSFLVPAEEIKYTTAPMYYPPTYFEMGDRNENKEIAERFVALTNKYPKEGLKAAQKARTHLNPFISYAQLLNSDNTPPEKIIELKNENYWRAIYSINNIEHLQEAFSWLNSQKDMKAKLEKLSPEEWLNMGNGIYTLYHLDVIFMIKGIFGGGEVGYHDILSNKYKNLKKARAIKDKEIDKKNKEEERLERQKIKKNEK